MRSFGVYHKFSMVLAARNIIRHWRKSVLAGSVGVLIMLLLALYGGNMESTERQLHALPEAIPVTGRISNLNGSQDVNLAIPEKTVQGIREAEEIKDAVFTVLLRSGLGIFTLEEWEGNMNFFMIGANDLAGVPGLKREEIRFLEGVDESILKTSEKVCIMDERALEQNHLSLGEEVTLTYFYYQYGDGLTTGHEILILPLMSGKCRIVGVMDIQEYTGTVGYPDLIIPFETARQMFHEQDIPFTADSASFEVKDPFRLNECKEELQGLGLLPVIKNAEYRYAGNAVTIRDDTFIRAAENLLESRAVLKGIRPFVVGMIVFTGYLCSYLLIRDRRKEYATMRSVGMGWGHCFFIYFLESTVIEGAACIVGSLLAMLSVGTEGAVLCRWGSLFLGAFLLGTGMALWSFRSMGVMAALSREG